MTQERLQELAARGWSFTRDGSTGTAFLLWEDPDDPESGWELQVLKSEGHRARFTLEPLESGLTERSPEEAQQLQEALTEVQELLGAWGGELLDEADA
jgi:2-polyprenyl-6-methoxyphenol hydroxylase-like FAD-dependent oxidoreductase